MAFKYTSLTRDPQRSPLYVAFNQTEKIEDFEDTYVPVRECGDSTQSDTPRSFSSAIKSYWIWALHTTLLLTSLTLFLFSQKARHCSTLDHVRQFSAWSPADTYVRYNDVKYNFTREGKKFVGYGPEVDAAWREISYDVGDQWIPKSGLAKLGMPEYSLKVDHPVTGEEGYRVGIEVFHHLHCLNLLRKVTYKDYYEPLGGEFTAGPEALQHHTDHCLEVLRMNIQCTADIGLFTLYMVDGDPQAWPELNSRHVCRDFGKIRDWAIENSVGNMEALA
ncbi:conserved hypothetical protein [Talaromyces stipitatus ATCC 10500]|uniref:Tat pathway signal sequence n=1 Tax=Talaromyces stipitatus (strain ATCC 10500 / CBS 375.48 / QM 6759 / NRRL 1006) TaxID=441959 RepID=B8MG15_TALSN|nr:uncharacterized protein TSTA_010000 [Talaromyces stipitatus ATCC 10500]EED15882.1 conserved hypothetical protein [Talaromyces stipitatus ATCC 10500]